MLATNFGVNQRTKNKTKHENSIVNKIHWFSWIKMGERSFIVLTYLVLNYIVNAHGATNQVKFNTSCTLDDLRNITDAFKSIEISDSPDPPSPVDFSFLDCDLSILPDVIFADVPSTQSINFTHTNISTISSYAFSGLRKLQALTIVANPNLTIFQSWTPHNLEQLTDLSLYNNGLLELDTLALRRYPKLSHLNLGENFIQEIPEAFFDFCLNIEILDLSANLLERIKSHTFKALLRMVELNLAHNQINHIDSYAFTTTTRLKRLHLNGNRIATIDSLIFHNLERLEFLNLHANALNEDSFEENAFQQSSNLLYLDVSNNSLSTVHTNALDGLKSLQVRSILFFYHRKILCLEKI